MTRVTAVAGRLVDPDGPAARFPTSAIPRVEAAMREWLQSHAPEAVVASAARGADLIALTHARQLGIRCRVVLPFGIAEFRQTSVGPDPLWTRRFDAAIADASARSDLVIVSPATTGGPAYRAATDRILQEARQLAGETAVPIVALLVWDGEANGPNDHTAYFRTIALASGCVIEEIRTV